jgi:hypothetical protein
LSKMTSARLCPLASSLCVEVGGVLWRNVSSCATLVAVTRTVTCKLPITNKRDLSHIPSYLSGINVPDKHLGEKFLWVALGR